MTPELEALLKEYGITPERFAQMSQAGVFDESMAALAPQMEMAQGAMGQPMPQGRMVSGFYVPPSPMANLSGLAGKMLSGYGMAQGAEQQKGLIDALRSGQEAAGVIGMKDRHDERMALLDLIRQMRGETTTEIKDPYASLDGVPDLLRRPE